MRHFLRNIFSSKLLVFAPFLLLLSCEKEVHFNLNSGPEQLVVNGQIETGNPPFVVLTHSFGYFSKVDLSVLQNSFVHDALMTVSDGAKSISLKEYSVDTGSGNTQAKFYFYTIDASDPNANNFLGEVGKTYTLNITTSDGKQYSSASKMPFPKPIDSMITEAPLSPSKNAPTARQLIIYYSDPDTPGNAVRYFTKRNHEGYFPGPNSVFDDGVVNGAKDARYPLALGSSDTRTTFNDSTGFAFVGDTITLKWAAIDRSV
ncbi:MAG: DUF4249 family protein, partial [Chitinophagaceae bacterium]